MRSSGAAEKSGEGMALKIFTEAKPFLKACMNPFDITETGMLAQTNGAAPNFLLDTEEKYFISLHSYRSVI
jgi:hypothetical protein